MTILADWGTTRLRLYLCDGLDRRASAVLGRANGPGVRHSSDFEQVFLECAGQLPAHAAACDVVMAGMIGSNIGWRPTGYVQCPVDWKHYAASGHAFAVDDYRITVLPGVSSMNEFGYHDIMRGEEVQVLGALQGDVAEGGCQLFCLPGTHTKWALVANGNLQSFATSIQGELFDILCGHSVLIPRPDLSHYRDAGVQDAAFDEGVSLLVSHADLSFAEALFAVRCRHVSGDPPDAEAVSYLSGIVVAADVRDVGQRLQRRFKIDGPVWIVGEETLGRLYGRALSAFGISARVLDGDACSVRGLYACSQRNLRRPVHDTG